MEIYSDASQVISTIPLVNSQGDALVVTAVDYRITAGDGTELLTRGALSGFTASDPTAVVTVSALINTLATGNVREVRRVELFLTLEDTNQASLNYVYAIAGQDVLVVGGNTFQSLADAQLTAMSMVDIPGWTAADADAQTAALIEANNHLKQLNFYLLNSQNLLDQTSLQYFPDVPWAQPENVFVFNGNLSLLTPAQYINLPVRFKTAMNLAQVAEANAILGGDTNYNSSRSGLVSETIGEAKQVYRAGRRLELPVCRRALSYLSLYVTFAKRIGRA